jgi:hypothetical protein
MANKLAGQKAKFTKALAEYNSTEDEARRQVALRQMCEVLLEARQHGFTEAEVTGGRDIPGEVQRMIDEGFSSQPIVEDPDQLVRQLEQKVDTTDLHEEGSGDQSVYAYGYRCAPDRLKIGRCDGDVIGRVISQIHTSTPDKPTLFLVVRTQDCRALEMAVHGLLQLRRRKITGGGDEWYLTTRDELLDIYRMIVGASSYETAVDVS